MNQTQNFGTQILTRRLKHNNRMFHAYPQPNLNPNPTQTSRHILNRMLEKLTPTSKNLDPNIFKHTKCNK